MNRQTKTIFIPFAIKDVDAESDIHTFRGLASTWGLDLGGDVIKKGAFKRTLGHWRKSKRKVPLVDSHNVFSSVTSVVGQMEEGEETEDGLIGDFSMVPDDERADAVFKRIKMGVADGLSIGYEAVRVEYPTTDEERKAGVYRYLSEVKLREISVVLFPMNPGARIDLATAKTLLSAAQDRTLDPEEVEELKAVQVQIMDLLKKAGGDGGEEEAAPVPPVVEAALADPAKAADLVSRISRLQQHGLATRLRAVQHSGQNVLTEL